MVSHLKKTRRVALIIQGWEMAEYLVADKGTGKQQCRGELVVGYSKTISELFYVIEQRRRATEVSVNRRVRWKLITPNKLKGKCTWICSVKSFSSFRRDVHPYRVTTSQSMVHSKCLFNLHANKLLDSVIYCDLIGLQWKTGKIIESHKLRGRKSIVESCPHFKGDGNDRQVEYYPFESPSTSDQVLVNYSAVRASEE